MTLKLVAIAYLSFKMGRSPFLSQNILEQISTRLVSINTDEFPDGV
ncbi:hypothetical protein [[Leptolyngbya] sp. PCC 7376]|nr:hypothetical protein [[Leptolyngbya] sp. PCC 7376]